MSDPRLDQLTDFTFAFTDGPRFYVGFETLPRTASGSGVGSETASRLIVSPRTATGSGVGASAVTELLVAKRTAVGAGEGASVTLGGLLNAKIGTGSGVGSSTATGLHIAPRTATGSGVGTSATSRVLVAKRTATGSGVGTSSVSYLERLPRTATGSGAGATSGSVTWNKLFIFRPPVGDTFPWVYRDTPVPGYSLLARLTPGQRARNIYKLTDGTFTNNQPAEVSDYVAVYLGAHNNFVSADEKADLIAAGYGEYVT